MKGGVVGWGGVVVVPGAGEVGREVHHHLEPRVEGLKPLALRLHLPLSAGVLGGALFAVPLLQRHEGGLGEAAGGVCVQRPGLVGAVDVGGELVPAEGGQRRGAGEQRQRGEQPPPHHRRHRCWREARGVAGRAGGTGRRRSAECAAPLTPSTKLPPWRLGVGYSCSLRQARPGWGFRLHPAAPYWNRDRGQ